MSDGEVNNPKMYSKRFMQMFIANIKAHEEAFSENFPKDHLTFVQWVDRFVKWAEWDDELEFLFFANIMEDGFNEIEDDGSWRNSNV